MAITAYIHIDSSKELRLKKILCDKSDSPQTREAQIKGNLAPKLPLPQTAFIALAITAYIHIDSSKELT